MRVPRRVLVGLTLGLATLALSGCYEQDREVTLHEPGVYKGPEDPLLSRSSEAELQEELRQRFDGQTDR